MTSIPSGGSTRRLSIVGGSVDVHIRHGLVTAAEVGERGPTLDASGCTVAPGFVDAQLNGGFGVDLTRAPERVGELAALLPQTGVTAFAPTVVTSSVRTTAHAVQVLTTRRERAPGEARSLGVHLEGPFLAPSRRGAHPERHLRPPSVEEVRSWPPGPGLAMVTLAPELPGALAVVRELVSRNVVVCLGHTAATPADVGLAVAAGVSGATHLYNAMGPFGSRDPGTVGTLLAHRALICGLIADGVHVDPVMVAVAWRALGPRQIALVTDAVAALGAGPGRYAIGHIEIVVDDTGARLASGVLAGSVLRMDQAVRNLIAFTGCSLADACISASTTPARLLRRRNVGRLTSGALGDVVLLDDQCRVVATVIGGHIAHDPDGRASRT